MLNFNRFVMRQILPLHLTQLNWVAAAIGAVTAIAGMIGGSKQAKAQAAAMARQAKLGEDQLAFAMSQYQDYKDMYGDLEESMVTEVEEYEAGINKEKYRGEATADTAMAFDKAKEASQRDMMRMGMDPTQARFQESDADLGRDRALATVTNLRGADMRSEMEDDKMFARKLAVGQFGKGISGSAEAVASASRAASDMYGQQAASYGRQSSDSYADAAKGARAAGYAISKYKSDDGGGGYDSGSYEDTYGEGTDWSK